MRLKVRLDEYLDSLFAGVISTQTGANIHFVGRRLFPRMMACDILVPLPVG
jgi:hypothetical protein